jgi:hypothetical protein
MHSTAPDPLQGVVPCPRTPQKRYATRAEAIKARHRAMQKVRDKLVLDVSNVSAQQLQKLRDKDDHQVQDIPAATEAQPPGDGDQGNPK